MLYREVKQKLVADIVSGAVPPGGGLPNESELAKRFGVSIGTVRRAVDELVADHILVRQQGRGTFVGRLDKERFMFQFFKVSARQGEPEFPQVQLLAFGKGRAHEVEAAALGEAVGAAVFRIENALSLKGRRVIHDRIVLDAAMFPGLNKPQLIQRSGTIYELYQSAYGITVVGAEERVRAESCNAASAKVLGLPEGVPVLHLVRVAFTFDQKPAELRVSVVDTCDHDYVARLVGQA